MKVCPENKKIARAHDFCLFVSVIHLHCAFVSFGPWYPSTRAITGASNAIPAIQLHTIKICIVRTPNLSLYNTGRITANHLSIARTRQVYIEVIPREKGIK